MGRKKLYETAAEKQAAYRERNGLVSISVTLSKELHEDFKQWLVFKDKGESEVICKLIRTQLLRKR
jgi:hypothetical protein